MIYGFILVINLIVFLLIPFDNVYFYILCLISIIWYLFKTYFFSKKFFDVNLDNNSCTYTNSDLRSPFTLLKKVVVSDKLNVDHQALTVIKFHHDLKVKNHYWARYVIKVILLSPILLVKYILKSGIYLFKNLVYYFLTIFITFEEKYLISFLKIIDELTALLDNIILIIDCYFEDYEDKTADKHLTRFQKSILQQYLQQILLISPKLSLMTMLINRRINRINN